jgi:hypothetical protein
MRLSEQALELPYLVSIFIEAGKIFTFIFSIFNKAAIKNCKTIGAHTAGIGF